MCVACVNHVAGLGPELPDADCLPGKYREMERTLRQLLAFAPKMPRETWPDGFVPVWAVKEIVDLYGEVEADVHGV